MRFAPVRQGELFAALPGSRHDGRDFIAEAVARGCAAVLIERPATSCGAGVPPALCSRDGCTTRDLPEVPVPVCVVPNVRDSHSRLCQALAGNPSRQLKLIGVTGTNGKTTTSCLIAGSAQGGRPSRGRAGHSGIP